MLRQASVVALTAVWLTGLAATADEAQPRVVRSAEIAWKPCPPDLLPGCAVTTLYGDPKQAGLFTTRTRVPAGYRLLPHFHPVEECVTVIAGGPYHVATGDAFDPAARTAVALRQGDFVCIPAGAHHYGWAEAETTIQAQGVGPFTRTYVNPADDPSRAK